MKKKKRGKKVFIFLGIIFLLLQILVIFRNENDYMNFFWFCNFAPILFGISFFFRKIQIIKSIINIALIPDIFFLIDLFSSLFFNFGIFGMVQPYLHENFIFAFTTIALHLTAFLALSATYKIKPNKTTLLYSTCLVLAIYFMTLLFSPPEGYYNYIYGTKPGYISPNFPHMIITILWPLIAFIFLILPSQGIQSVIYGWHKHKNKK